MGPKPVQILETLDHCLLGGMRLVVSYDSSLSILRLSRVSNVMYNFATVLDVLHRIGWRL